MMLFGLLVLFICVQGRHFIRVFDLGSAREHRQTRRSALTGAFVIVSWYWIAVLTLSVVEALTIGLLPDVEAVASGLVSIVPQTLETPLVTLLFAGAGSIAIVVLRAMFVLRELLLYVFLHVMPIGIGIAYGNVPIVSEIARRFCVQFVALAVLPIPTALLLRGYSLLFSGSETISIGSPFVAYVAVISLPIVAAYVTWKTFAYAAPLTSRALGRASRGTILVGTVGAAAHAAGPRAAAMATKWGPRGAASAMLSERNDSRDPGDSTATDSGDDRASYRRTENDRR
jgi:type IV secretion system protein TrbL